MKVIKKDILKVNLRESANTPTLKEKLFYRQEGICLLYQGNINFDKLHENMYHIHHINPIAKGGSNFTLSNLSLTHI